jgi:peptidoglycan/xylan/chitin deacetylase (PgdA/CDA1 family)
MIMGTWKKNAILAMSLALMSVSLLFPCATHAAAISSKVVSPSVTVPVLLYHYVRPWTGLTALGQGLSVTPERFAAQMEELVRLKYHAITPESLRAAIDHHARLPRNPILITFDDGYADQYMNALPVLKKLHLTATFFIISDFVGRKDYVTQDMLKDMDRSGLAIIGAHTVHHEALATISSAMCKKEVVDSKIALEKILGHDVTDFAYPFGSLSKTAETQVAQAGFHTAFSTLLGEIHTSSTLFTLRRMRVANGDSIAQVIHRTAIATSFANNVAVALK